MISESLVFSTARFLDYLELAKLRLVSLVLLSTAVGFFLASGKEFNGLLFFSTLTGTGLVAAGSMSLNQWMERSEDARMVRTASRPLPAGRLNPVEAFLFGILLSTLGIALLCLTVNRCAVLLAVFTSLSYLLLYTPLKRKTSLCTIVGALPGAVPPLIGWAAVSGKPSYEAWILFAIIFLWQMPHFLSIAWLYRKDYAAAGFKMLSVEDPDGNLVARQIFIYSLALVPISLLPALAGLCGRFYFWTVLILGIGFIGLVVKSLRNINQRASWLFRASILYLALLLILMVIDKT